MTVHHAHPAPSHQRIKLPRRMFVCLKWVAIALWAIAFVLALAPLL